MSKVAMTEGGPTRTSNTGTVGREAEANTIAKGVTPQLPTSMPGSQPTEMQPGPVVANSRFYWLCSRRWKVPPSTIVPLGEVAERCAYPILPQSSAKTEGIAVPGAGTNVNQMFGALFPFGRGYFRLVKKGLGKVSASPAPHRFLTLLTMVGDSARSAATVMHKD